jgi:hypothetical protein
LAFALGHVQLRLWLVTTNDNLRALELYQRWGMEIVAFHRHAVTEARRHLKPSIPERGTHGIPIAMSSSWNSASSLVAPVVSLGGCLWFSAATSLLNPLRCEVVYFTRIDVEHDLAPSGIRILDRHRRCVFVVDGLTGQIAYEDRLASHSLFSLRDCQRARIDTKSHGSAAPPPRPAMQSQKDALP